MSEKKCVFLDTTCSDRSYISQENKGTMVECTTNKHITSVSHLLVRQKNLYLRAYTKLNSDFVYLCRVRKSN